MYDYKNGTIVNSATGFKEVNIAHASGATLLRIFELSVPGVERNEGDVTHEDIALVKQELLRRLNSHP